MVSLLPDAKTFGRACKYINNPSFSHARPKMDNPDNINDKKYSEKLNNDNIQTGAYNFDQEKSLIRSNLP